MNNIVGNIEKLTECKNALKTSSEKLSIYWGLLILGLWFFQQPEVKNITLSSTFSNVQITLVFTVILLILLISTVIFTLSKYSSIDFGTKTKVIDEIFRVNKNAGNLTFKCFLRNFHVEHPILTLSIIGLILNQIYFTDYYIRIVDLFKQIPLLNSFYTISFSVIPLILLIVVSEYICYIKNNILRKALTVIILIEVPVIFTGVLLGLCSIFLYPIINIINNFHAISFLGTWITNITNLVVVLSIPIIVKHMLVNSLVKDIDQEIKLIDNDIKS